MSSLPWCPEKGVGTAVIPPVPPSSCVMCSITWLGLALCNPVDCSPSGFSVHGDCPGKNTGVCCHFLLHLPSSLRKNSRAGICVLLPHTPLFISLCPKGRMKILLGALTGQEKLDFPGAESILCCFCN